MHESAAAWCQHFADIQRAAASLTPVPVIHYCHVAAWRSGNSVGRINEVTLRRARLVLGWVTCTGSTSGRGTLFRYVTSNAGRLSLSSF